jgi:hypothetical protein
MIRVHPTLYQSFALEPNLKTGHQPIHLLLWNEAKIWIGGIDLKREVMGFLVACGGGTKWMPLFPYRLDKQVVLFCNELEIGPMSGEKNTQKKESQRAWQPNY